MFKQINLITALFAYAQANQAMHKRTQDDLDGTFDIDEDEFSDDWEEFVTEGQACIIHKGVYVENTDAAWNHCLIYENTNTLNVEARCGNTGCYDSLANDCAS